MLLASVRVRAYLKVSPPLMSAPTLHDIVGPLGRGGAFDVHVLARKGWQVRASPAREDLLPGKGR